MVLAVTSAKDIKVNAVKSVFSKRVVKGYKTSAPMAEQPIDTKEFPEIGILGAILRINYLLEGNNEDFNRDRPKITEIISMENSINVDAKTEVSNVVFYNCKEKRFYKFSFPVKIQKPIMKYIKEAIKETPADYKYRHYGYSTTVGKMINKNNPKIPDSDWLAFFGKMDRVKQLDESIKKLYKKYFK